MSSSLKISACPLFVLLASGSASYAQKVGPTWNLNRNLMLRPEYSRHNGTYPLPARENDPADLVKVWDLMTPQVAVRF